MNFFFFWNDFFFKHFAMLALLQQFGRLFKSLMITMSAVEWLPNEIEVLAVLVQNLIVTTRCVCETPCPCNSIIFEMAFSTLTLDTWVQGQSH